MASKLYFAYGSNLSLNQMASRCPSGVYVGRGVLPDYCWQINERGFANIISRSGFSVHGLVYQISIDDEIRLDRHEGVSSGSYSKQTEGIIVYPAVPDLRLPTQCLVGDGLPRALDRAKFSPRTKYLQGNILVYASKTFIQDGLPREEYISRMNAGIWDAKRLGVPADYFENVVRLKIPDLPILRPSARPVNRRVPAIPPARVSEPLHMHRERSVPAERRRRASYGEVLFPTGTLLNDDPAPSYGGARVVTAYPPLSRPPSPRRWEQTRQYY